jgi:hypothetical protein
VRLRLRLRVYRGTPAARLPRRAFAAAPVVAVLALMAGGCSYQLDSLTSKNDAGADYTGSIRAPGPKADAALPPEHDLAVARAAASEFLSHGGDDTSMPWENPSTGARGTITPIAQSYTQDGLTCRDFLASYLREGTESWLQGEACRMQQGKWRVRNLKPWQKT